MHAAGIALATNVHVMVHEPEHGIIRSLRVELGRHTS
jgi:hypothetical protein